MSGSKIAIAIAVWPGPKPSWSSFDQGYYIGYLQGLRRCCPPGKVEEQLISELLGLMLGTSSLEGRRG